MRRLAVWTVVLGAVVAALIAADPSGLWMAGKTTSHDPAAAAARADVALDAALDRLIAAAGRYSAAAGAVDRAGRGTAVRMFSSYGAACRYVSAEAVEVYCPQTRAASGNEDLGELTRLRTALDEFADGRYSLATVLRQRRAAAVKRARRNPAWSPYADALQGLIRGSSELSASARSAAMRVQGRIDALRALAGAGRAAND